MKPYCYGFTMVLVFLNFVVVSSFSFTFLFCRGELFLSVGNSFVDSVVPVITFVFHSSMVEFIPRIWRPTEFVIVCEKISIFSSVPSEQLSICSSVLLEKFPSLRPILLIALIISFLKYTASSLSRDGLLSRSSISFLFLSFLFLSQMFQPTLPSSIPPIFLKDI